MFWIISALLVVIACVLLFPALKKNVLAVDATRQQNISIAQEQLQDLETLFEKGDIDQTTYQSTRNELEISLFNDLDKTEDTQDKKEKHSLIGSYSILLLIPLLAFSLYFNFGQIEFVKRIDSKVTAKEIIKTNRQSNADGSLDIEKMVENLQIKMNKNPADSKGWYMLGRSYIFLKRFPEAISSFEKSLALKPESAEILLSLADALSMQNKGQLIGKPKVLVNKALAIEPNNITALWLSGMAANQEKEYSQAITQWQKILPLIQDKPEEIDIVNNLIIDAKSQINETQNKQKSKSIASEPSKIEKNVKLVVKMTDAFKNKVLSNDVVFIYAKAVSGPPMPLAAIKKRVENFPIEITLNDEMAMIPDLKISGFSEVLVGARISKSGKAIPQNGDFFAEELKMKMGEKVTLEINQIFKK